MTIKYPKNVNEFKALRSHYNNGKLSGDDVKIAESFITQWQVTTGAYALKVLVKVSGKSQTAIANDLGIKPRQLNEMMNGLNGISPNKAILARYFNVSENLLNDYRQTEKTKSVK